MSTKSTSTVSVNGARVERMFGKSKKKGSLHKRCDDSLKFWSQAGVFVMAGMSMMLNGYANSQHAASPLAGWCMGFAIPIVVLILGKVSGLLFKRNLLSFAKIAGCVGACLLFLSVWHCSVSISMLTGSGVMLAVPMAITIDCGLVVCEIAALIVL